MKVISWYRNGWYTLHEDGRIEKPDGYISDGKSWEFIGFHKKLPFGMIGKLIPREECFKIDPKDLRFKNGKTKYLVADKDHGTTRIWMQ